MLPQSRHPTRCSIGCAPSPTTRSDDTRRMELVVPRWWWIPTAMTSTAMAMATSMPAPKASTENDSTCPQHQHQWWHRNYVTPSTQQWQQPPPQLLQHPEPLPWATSHGVEVGSNREGIEWQGGDRTKGMMHRSYFILPSHLLVLYSIWYSTTMHMFMICSPQTIKWWCTVCENSFLHTKAMAWAKPSQSQAVSGGFGLAWGLRKPKLPQARPKPGFSGQAGLEQH